MNRELSAGGIIACKGSRGWSVLLIKDMNGKWTFPKGKIENGEELVTTARREIEEEVGITDLAEVAELTPSQYWYFRGASIKKTVQYFLFISKKRQTPVVQTEEGITEAKWVPWQDAKKRIGYPDTNMPLLKEAYIKLTTIT